jgi:hypothetical protein
MSDWTNPVIAVAAALLSSGLTGVITLRAAGRQADRQQRSDLAAALQAFGYAADRLRLEIDQLPPPPGRLAASLQSASSRLRALDWSVGQISRHTLGRPVLSALDTYNAALNRLMLIAPTAVLEPMETLNGLLGRVQERDEAWADDWSSARGALTKAAREAVHSPRWPSHVTP